MNTTTFPALDGREADDRARRAWAIARRTLVFLLVAGAAAVGEPWLIESAPPTLHEAVATMSLQRCGAVRGHGLLARVSGRVECQARPMGS